MGVLSARAGSGGCATTADLFRQAQASCQDSLNRLMAEHDPTFSPDMIAGQLRHAAALGLGRAALEEVRIIEIDA